MAGSSAGSSAGSIALRSAACFFAGATALALTQSLIRRRRRRNGGGLQEVQEVRLVLAGFGDVNRAFARLLLGWEGRLLREARLRVRVVAITTARHGSVIARGRDGSSHIDLGRALARVSGDGATAMLDASVVTGAVQTCHASALSTQEAQEAFVVQAAEEVNMSSSSPSSRGALVEAIPVNYEDGQPAAGLLAVALRHGLHAISANKGPVVHHRTALLALAKGGSGDDGGGNGAAWTTTTTTTTKTTTAAAAPARCQRYLHESAVMDGVPIFNLAASCLPLARLTKLRGCLNSTTTVILSRMEGCSGGGGGGGGGGGSGTEGASGSARGESFAEALQAAQDMGICETDPSGDVDGMDAAVKLTALVATLGGGAGGEKMVDEGREGGGEGGGGGGGGGGTGGVTIIPDTRSREAAANRESRVEEAAAEAAEAAGPLWWAREEQGAREGIRSVTAEAVADAERDGRKRWRLVATAERVAAGGDGGVAVTGGGRVVWRARVAPELLLPNDPLHGLMGASSAVELHTDALAPVTVVSSDPTTQDTAYGLLADLIEATRQERGG